MSVQYPWACKGAGSYHGFRKGQLWFMCERCRWAHPEPSRQQLAREAAYDARRASRIGPPVPDGLFPPVDHG